MSVFSSLAVRAALIAVGGVVVTLIATAALVLLYCCTCRHRPNKGWWEQRDNPSSITYRAPLYRRGQYIIHCTYGDGKHGWYDRVSIVWWSGVS